MLILIASYIKRDGEREQTRERANNMSNKKTNSKWKELNTILAVIMGNANALNIVRLNRNQTQS